MRRWKIHGCVALLMATALPLAWAGDRPPRIWILPFHNPEADASVAHLEEAIPALLAVVMSQSAQHAIV
ncbi:MAG: hypothetical protein AAB016_13540, partial [candidate division NC10 bacterium]